MTTTDLCIHDMRAEWCSECNGQPPTGRYPDKPPTIPARYGGHCQICDQDYPGGTDIVADRAGGGWVHAACDVWDLEWSEL